MNKQKEIMKVFIKAVMNNEEAIKWITADSYAPTIKEIDYKKLKEKGIKNILFDIDNTIMPVNDIIVSTELKKFINTLKKDFTICLLSNNGEDRVNPVANALEVLAISNANKPLSDGYGQALTKIRGTKENTAMVGDQILTDIVGGNKYELYTILVEPYQKKYDINTGINRILQNILMIKLRKKIKRYQYY